MKMPSTILQRFYNKKKTRGRNPRKGKHIFYNALSRRGEKLIYAKPFGWLPDVLLATVLRCYDAAMVRYLGGLGVLGFWFGFGLVCFSLAALSQISYTFALCSIFFSTSFFFFLGPIAACGIWQTVVEQAALRANSEKKDTLNLGTCGKGYTSIT